MQWSTYRPLTCYFKPGNQLLCMNVVTLSLGTGDDTVRPRLLLQRQDQIYCFSLTMVKESWLQDQSTALLSIVLSLPLHGRLLRAFKMNWQRPHNLLLLPLSGLLNLATGHLSMVSQPRMSTDSTFCLPPLHNRWPAFRVCHTAAAASSTLGQCLQIHSSLPRLTEAVEQFKHLHQGIFGTSASNFCYYLLCIIGFHVTIILSYSLYPFDLSSFWPHTGHHSLLKWWPCFAI